MQRVPRGRDTVVPCGGEGGGNASRVDLKS